MTIKQQGGIFGRNPTFNNVTVDGQTTFNSNITVQNDTAPKISILDSNSGFDAATFTSENGGRDLAIFAPQDIIFDQSGMETARFLDGGGITFNGDTANSNALDDYEEGQHTATATPQTSGTITLSSTSDELSYTKVGRLVSVTGHLSVDSVSSPVGDFVTISLPFAIGSLDEASGDFAGAGGTNASGSWLPVLIRGNEGDSDCDVYFDASTLSSGKRIEIGITYHTS